MDKVKTDDQLIENFLTRAVENAYPSKDQFASALKSGKKLSAYLGIDPTGPSLHLGHAIAMKKLRELQDMGHRVILLIGDFTAMIGDPTDKAATRKQLAREQVLENCKNYAEQAKKILDMDGSKTGNPVEMKFNSEWLAKMSFADVVELASHFTVQQMSERDMFRRRMSWRSICPKCNNENYRASEGSSTSSDDHGGQILISPFDTQDWKCKECGEEYTPEDGNNLHSPRPVYLHEFLYPLMQGYDSVAMDVDIEIGGNDQTFNMLAGRTLMKEGILGHKAKEKYVLTNKLLADTTGKKMGKSEGNMITLADTPEDMFGKVMSWTDGMIISGFELCTNVPEKTYKGIYEVAMDRKDSREGNPMIYKRKLAHEIVEEWYSKDDADKAEAHFDRLFKNHEAPEDMPEFTVATRNHKLTDLLVLAELVPSKSEARRQIEQGAVKVNDEVIEDPDAEIEIADKGTVIQKGKRFFAKILCTR